MVTQLELKSLKPTSKSRQQFVQPQFVQPMSRMDGHAGKHIREPGLRIDTIHLGRDDWPQQIVASSKSFASSLFRRHRFTLAALTPNRLRASRCDAPPSRRLEPEREGRTRLSAHRLDDAVPGCDERQAAAILARTTSVPARSKLAVPPLPMPSVKVTHRRPAARPSTASATSSPEVALRPSAAIVLVGNQIRTYS
jgi:hypothetical protein